MTPRNPTIKWLTTLAIAALLSLASWVAWDNWGRFVFTPTTTSSQPETRPTSQALAQGEYLARIGGCIACHTSKGGEPLAGGRRIDTPFGAVFSSNLTSSKTHGIGQWTAADFEHALHWGRSRDGRLLLPVFPYNHTSVFTTTDDKPFFLGCKVSNLWSRHNLHIASRGHWAHNLLLRCGAPCTSPPRPSNLMTKRPPNGTVART
jgi:hypothetical protein